MSSVRSGGIDRLLGMLVAYRMVIYFGGLILISMPLGLAWLANYETPRSVRVAIVAGCLSLMVATYIGERRVGRGHVDDRTGQATEEYDFRTRLTVGLAVVGLAVGVYAALEVSLLAGLLFVGGAYLFAYIAFTGGE